MCQFIEAMEGLKSSSNLSVANEKFSKFNKYMHIASKMDDRLKEVILFAKSKQKALVLVCGNSGDGKSHLIANFINQGIIQLDEFDVYIDATASDKKGKRANEKLREKLDGFSDLKIEDGNSYRLIVAINLGVLNDFIKNYENEYSVLKKYVDKQGLFDNIPAWKFILMENDFEEQKSYSLGHVDFTSFHRYELRSTGIDATFFSGLLEKVVSDCEDNEIYQAYANECKNCDHKSNCPIYWNYKELIENKKLREHIIDVLVKAIIKGNLLPSVREINDFFYEIIIGRTFDERAITSRSINRLTHFIKNMTLWILYENTEGLLQYTAQEDVLGDQGRKCDKQIISLNLKPDFESWLQETAMKVSPIYIQIFNDILYCKDINAKKYKDNEQEIKRMIFKLFIRSTNLANDIMDEKYSNYLKHLFYYNIGAEDKCKEVIQLIEECVYLWNGRLGDKSGTNVKNGVIINRASSKFYLFKKMDIKFAKNSEIQQLDQCTEFPNFSSIMRFEFKLKDSKTIIPLDINYELYAFLLEVKEGFIPTNSERKKNVEYDAFVRKLIAESDSDTYVYARNEEGKTYRISKDDFDNYTFDYEV
ncbi:MAG: DNA phosphorothioation-dependent restriction protein DptF [Lachnospiraceae bacterium]|nr:DNA phosphorothioation-dependent restriction protein DptF [Lachnospiraceae bacterium]